MKKKHRRLIMKNSPNQKGSSWMPFSRLPDIRIPRNPEAEVYVNNRYQVIKEVQYPSDPSLSPLVHLSIRHLDRRALHDWRDLQRIKNELVHPQSEGLELYPAENRLVDTSNQYHLWVFADPTFRLSFGFSERQVAEGPYTNAAVQSPWEPEDRPRDCLSGRDMDARLALEPTFYDQEEVDDPFLER